MEVHYQKINNTNLNKSKRSKSQQRQANLYSIGGPEIKSLFLVKVVLSRGIMETFGVSRKTKNVKLRGDVTRGET